MYRKVYVWLRVPPSCLAMPADFFAAFFGLIPMFHQCMRPRSGVLILKVSRQTPLEWQVILRHVPCNMHMYTPIHAGTRLHGVEMSRVDAQTSSRHTDISECTHTHTYTGIHRRQIFIETSDICTYLYIHIVVYTWNILWRAVVYIYIHIYIYIQYEFVP